MVQKLTIYSRFFWIDHNVNPNRTSFTVNVWRACQENFTFKITLWSACSSNKLSVGKASICCRIDCAIAGTNDRGGRSKSSHKASANCSGVIKDSKIEKTKTKKHTIKNDSFYN